MAAYEILIADDHPLFRSALQQALTLGLGDDVRLSEAASIAVELLKADFAGLDKRSQEDFLRSYGDELEVPGLTFDVLRNFRRP